MNYTVREMRLHEYKFLDEFLYEAIFVPDGMEPPSRAIIAQPELQVYIADFGKKDDNCLVVEIRGILVGAVWSRIMDDYGHIDNQTPSLAISIFKEFRGFGIGTTLMKRMLTLLKAKGYKRVSLSVQKANYAVKLYLQVGFYVMNENEDEYIMVCDL